MYISVGVDCGPANIFNELGLRTVSLPFDWVVTYKGVAHIINNEFSNYLPLDTCDVMNNDCAVRFHHNTFPSDFETLSRRIDRFKQILETSTEKITFLRKGHGEHHHSEYPLLGDDINDAIQLDTVLRTKYHHLDYEIHVILICDPCFTTNTKKYNEPDTVKIHNLARPYTKDLNVTNPPYFNELCRRLFV